MANFNRLLISVGFVAFFGQRVDTATLAEECTDRDVVIYALQDSSLSSVTTTYIASLAKWAADSGFGNTTGRRLEESNARQIGVAVFNDKEQASLPSSDAQCFQEVFPLGPADAINTTDIPSGLSKGDEYQDSWSAIVLTLQANIFRNLPEGTAKMIVLVTDALPHTFNNSLPLEVTEIPEATTTEEEAEITTEEEAETTTEEETETTTEEENETTTEEETETTTEEETQTITTLASTESSASARRLQEETTTGEEEEEETTTGEEETTTGEEEETTTGEEEETTTGEEEEETTNGEGANPNVDIEFIPPEQIKDVKCDSNQGYPRFETVIHLMAKTQTYMLVLSNNPAWKKLAELMPNTYYQEPPPAPKAARLTTLQADSTATTTTTSTTESASIPPAFLNETFPQSMGGLSTYSCIAAALSDHPERFKWWIGLIIVLAVALATVVFAAIWEFSGMGRRKKGTTETMAGGAGAGVLTASRQDRETAIPASRPAAPSPVVPAQPATPTTVPATAAKEMPPEPVVVDAAAAGNTVVSPDIVIPAIADKKGSTESVTATQGAGTAQGAPKDDKTVTSVREVEHVESKGGISALKEKFSGGT